MRSRPQRTERRPATCSRLALLVLLLMLAAKPADWLGSRGKSGGGPNSEWNTRPKRNWWQYKCPIDGEFFQTRDKPTSPVFCQNENHWVRVSMDLIHNPRRD